MKSLLKRSFFVIFCVSAAANLVFLYFVWSGRLHLYGQRLPSIEGIGMIPTMTIVELEHAQPFTATVEQRRIGTWKAVANTTSGVRKSDNRSAEYILMYLRQTSGKELAVYKENPSADEIAFVSSLEEGHDYLFPRVMITWAAANEDQKARKDNANHK